MTVVDINPNQCKPQVGSTVVARTAPVAMTVGDVVYPDGDENVRLTDANTPATVTGQVWLVVAGGRHLPSGAIAAGERVTCLQQGRVYLGDDADLDTTQDYFASDTAGKMEDLPGTTVRRLGSPESSTVFIWNPGTAGATS